MNFKITFTDKFNSLNHNIKSITIGSVGTLSGGKDFIICMKDFLNKTGNCTHIALCDEEGNIKKLYPKHQILRIEEEEKRINFF